MKKTVSLFLALLTALSSLFAFSSCNGGNEFVRLPGAPEMKVEFESISDRKDLLYSFYTPDDFVFNGANANGIVSYGAKGDGKTDDSAAFNTAIADSANKAIVLQSGNYYLASSVTVPENVTLIFAEGAVITVKSGALLKIESASLYAPHSKIFSGDGAVTVSLPVKPEWFGAKANNSTDCAPAFRKAFDASSTVYLGAGNYRINGSVELPNHDISIIGAGHNATIITSNNGGKALFTNKTVKGNHDVYIAFLKAQTTANPSGIFVDYKGTGKFTSENIIANWFAKTVVLENSVGSYIHRSHYHVSGIGITATNCKNTTVESTLVNDAEAFLRINGGENLYVINSSGVWNHAVDIEVKNFKNFDMVDSSTDLGYNHRDHAKNRYAIYFENVDGFKLRGCWVATNGGLSGMCVDTTPSVPHILSDDERTGIYITSCQDGLIAGNSINNHTTGIQVLNSPSNAKAIVIEGNSLNGNGKATTMAGAPMPGIKSAIYCKNTANVEVSMNFFNRYYSGSAFVDAEMISEGTNVNFKIVGNSFSKIGSQAKLESQNPTAIFDSNMVSIT